MILNQKVATSFLNHSARAIKGVMKDKDQMVKKNLLRFNFSDDDLERLKKRHMEADALDNRYVVYLNDGHPEVLQFEGRLKTTFDIVERHMDLLNLEKDGDPDLDAVITLKKPRFFYRTDEAIDLAKKQYENILSSGKAQLALQNRGVSIGEIREAAANVLKLRKERKQYAARNSEIVEIERARQEAFVKLAVALKEVETVGFTALRGLNYKDGKNVLMDPGIPFLDMVLSNWYDPPDGKMVKDSSIT
jgi:hypothetical protein